MRLSPPKLFRRSAQRPMTPLGKQVVEMLRAVVPAELEDTDGQAIHEVRCHDVARFRWSINRSRPE